MRAPPHAIRPASNDFPATRASLHPERKNRWHTPIRRRPPRPWSSTGRNSKRGAGWQGTSAPTSRQAARGRMRTRRNSYHPGTTAHVDAVTKPWPGDKAVKKVSSEHPAGSNRRRLPWSWLRRSSEQHRASGYRQGPPRRINMYYLISESGWVPSTEPDPSLGPAGQIPGET